jgi:hypothetical protein
MSIDEYYSTFDHLMGSLISMVPQCTAGKNCTTLSFIEQFLTCRFVMGVKAEFDSIRTRLLHTSSTLTMTKALSELLVEETLFRLCLLCLTLTVCWQLLISELLH